MKRRSFLKIAGVLSAAAVLPIPICADIERIEPVDKTPPEDYSNFEAALQAAWKKSQEEFEQTILYGRPVNV